jgi:hypothetical protein
MDAPMNVWMLGALAGLIIGYFVSVALIFRRLKFHHPEKWTELGNPSLFKRRSFAEKPACRELHFYRQYARLEDAKLRYVGDIALLCAVAVLGIGLYFSITGHSSNHVCSNC